MPLFDFHVQPEVASAAALVSHFFEPGDGFWKNRPVTTVKAPASNFELQSYLKLLHAGPTSNEMDDRINTPEVIFDVPINLIAGVKAAILPDELAGEDGIGGRLSALGLTIREYEWSTLSRPAEHHSTIRKLVRGLYAEFGWAG